jgi:hypothetical protein
MQLTSDGVPDWDYATRLPDLRTLVRHLLGVTPPENFTIHAGRPPVPYRRR